MFSSGIFSEETVEQNLIEKKHMENQKIEQQKRIEQLRKSIAQLSQNDTIILKNSPNSPPEEVQLTCMKYELQFKHRQAQERRIQELKKKIFAINSDPSLLKEVTPQSTMEEKQLSDILDRLSSGKSEKSDSKNSEPNTTVKVDVGSKI